MLQLNNNNKFIVKTQCADDKTTQQRHSANQPNPNFKKYLQFSLFIHFHNITQRYIQYITTAKV